MTEERIDVTFSDVQAIQVPFGPIPEQASKLVGLVTKVAMATFLTYYSLQELVSELRTYRANTQKEHAHDNGAS